MTSAISQQRALLNSHTTHNSNSRQAPQSVTAPQILYSQSRLRPTKSRGDLQIGQSFNSDSIRSRTSPSPRLDTSSSPLLNKGVENNTAEGQGLFDEPEPDAKMISQDMAGMTINSHGNTQNRLMDHGQVSMAHRFTAEHAGELQSSIEQHMQAESETELSSDDGGDEGSSEDGAEEYVVALHDFSSNNETCLSFVSGQVIRVFNRDESGWWDGELDGQRGWFPSNYVDEGGLSSDVNDFGPHDQTYYNEDDGPAQATPENFDGKRNAAWPIHARAYNETPASSSSQHTATYANPRGLPYSGTVSSRSPTPTANSLMQNKAGSSGSSGNTTIRSYRKYNQSSDLDAGIQLPGVLEPIHHAISLLHNAVRANRVAHFQPSTACVISSVRSVLSSTDCLTRESPVLKAHPVLAKERKQILAELSKLVTQARRASLPMNENESIIEEMERMLQMADQVMFNVKRFLDVAVECGVPIPDKRSSVYDDLYNEPKLSTGRVNSSSRSGGIPNRFDQDKTPTPDSPRSSTYRTAFTSDHVSPRSSKSYVDLRGQNPPNHVIRVDAGWMTQAAHRKAQGLDSTSSANGLMTSPFSSSANAQESREDLHSTSPEANSDSESPSHGAHHSSDDSHEGPIPSEPKECAPLEVLERIQYANDHLLSIIAAFIGHIHGHTRESHASSYAFLIDMTRATVDGVRNLLVIVEAVHACQALQTKMSKQLAHLWESREKIYEATASLVTAARVITSSTGRRPSATESPSLGNSGEEEEKNKLLHSATLVLRTGGECVGAAKLCLNRVDSSIRITLAMPPSAANSRSQKDQYKNENDEAATESGEAFSEEPEVRRNKHTLSYLGRKATSLSCLRERYEQDLDDEDSPVSRFADVAEELLETSHDSFVSSPDMKKAATKGPSNGQHAEAAESSDSSEPMSRDHSRTSGSTLHSSQSITTPSTSARPSMDRGDAVNAAAAASMQHQQHQQPHTNFTVPFDGLPTSSTTRLSVSGTANQRGEKQFTSSVPQVGDRSASLPRSNDLDTHSRNGSMSKPQNSFSSESSSPASVSSPQFPSPPKRVGRSLSSDARILAPDYDPSEICFNSEGQLTGATLKALVEKMTPHNTTIDATLSNAFFLCFRLFTTPMELFEALESRYNMRPPTEIEMNADDFTRWTELKVAPVRLRVFNFFKLWLENHWHAPTDHCILEKLIEFTQTSMMHSLNKPGQRLSEMAKKRLSAGPNAKAQTVAVHSVGVSGTGTRGPGSLKRMVSTERVKTTPGLTEIVNLYAPNSIPKGSSSAPQPNLSKSLMAQLKQMAPARVNVMEFDPLELARQLTVMESRIYCAILPEELLGQEFSKKVGVSNAVNVKRMSALSTHITGWVSECILNEDDARKRTQFVKFFIKLGDRCLSLNNFNALFAIQSALNSSTIARLKRTWDGLSTKYRSLMDQQRRAVEHTRNFAVYRQKLRSIMPPALPFVGLFLTDLTFCHEGNASTRPSPSDPNKRLINFDKYVKMSRIIGELQRFQIPYNLLEVPEIQTYLSSMLELSSEGKSAVTADELYRRSLRLEPRNNSSGTLNGYSGMMPLTGNDGSSAQNTGTISNRSGLGGVGGLDIFNWK